MMKKKDEKKGFRVVLPFLIIILVIFLIAVSLSWKNITKFFARLGIVPLAGIMEFPPQEFTYTIPSSELRAGSVVHYWSFANDTPAGNTNTTNSTPGVFRTFQVIYPENITKIEILNSSGDPDTQINKNENFYIRVFYNNSRMSDLYAWVIFQVLDPNGISVRALEGQSQHHFPADEEYIQKSYSTGGNEFFVGNGYIAEVRIFNETWGKDGGFKICTTKSATFDIV